MTIDFNDVKRQPEAEQAERNEPVNTTGGYDKNFITGTEKPDDFQIHNDNPLHDMLPDIMSEIQWLTSEGYRWTGEDLDWARYLLVSVALAMREPLGRLLEDIVSAYQVFQTDDFHDPRSRIPERDASLGEVDRATWDSLRAGASEYDLLDKVRKVVAGFKASKMSEVSK